MWSWHPSGMWLMTCQLSIIQLSIPYSMLNNFYHSVISSYKSDVINSFHTFLLNCRHTILLTKSKNQSRVPYIRWNHGKFSAKLDWTFIIELMVSLSKLLTDRILYPPYWIVSTQTVYGYSIMFTLLYRSRRRIVINKLRLAQVQIVSSGWLISINRSTANRNRLIRSQ